MFFNFNKNWNKYIKRYKNLKAISFVEKKFFILKKGFSGSVLEKSF